MSQQINSTLKQKHKVKVTPVNRGGKNIMSIATINPTTENPLKTFEPLTDSKIEAKLALADKTFKEYCKTTMAQRS